MLGRTRISGRALRNLAIGDIITLNADVNQPLQVYIADIPKLLAVAGHYKGSQAIQIVGRIENRS